MQTQHVRSLQSANDMKFCVFANDAFVFKSFNESPWHLNQKRSSLFFKLAGSLPTGEEPVISSSKQAQPYMTIKTIMEKPCRGLTSLASTLLVPGRLSGPPYLHSVYGVQTSRK